MVVSIIGLDADGNVVEDIDDAVKVYETEYDDDGLVLETIYYKED